MITEHDFDALLQRLRRPVRRDTGTAPVTTPDFARLIRHGISIACGEGPAQALHAPETPPSPNGAAPYRVRQWQDGWGRWRAVNDRVEFDVHGGEAMTHIDALEHFAWGDDAGRSGLPFGRDPMAALAKGIVGRGVLLDLAGPDVVPGTAVPHSRVQQIIARQGVALHPGDALYIRFGRVDPLHSGVPLGSQPATGLSVDTAEWLAELSPSVVVTDNGLDPIPSDVEGVPTPLHVLLLTALATPLVDLADLGELSATCSRLDTWEFLSVIAPIHLPGASGAPVNPIAIL